LPAFKWLRLFDKKSLEQLVQAQLFALHSVSYLLEYTKEEGERIKKSVEAQVGEYFKDRFNCGKDKTFIIYWDTT
jgi:hypothetical protein